MYPVFLRVVLVLAAVVVFLGEASAGTKLRADGAPFSPPVAAHGAPADPFAASHGRVSPGQGAWPVPGAAVIENFNTAALQDFSGAAKPFETGQNDLTLIFFSRVKGIEAGTGPLRNARAGNVKAEVQDGIVRRRQQASKAAERRAFAPV